ncbi:Adenylyl cyclase class-3/4/guanylyl cyclase domain protein [Candidatus Magnetoovum chiemensis]|nr:Adenylyl cyclase class-3/4/guanylyl cyclase domain protein [Candidatus Magnetoovum chiemensis]
MQDDIGIEEILREREKIEEKLSQYRSNMAVMFSDIKGSTEFYDKWGDVEGRIMVQHCNDIILPVIKQKGLNYKNLGDGIMAYFDSAECAVRAAIQMQKSIHRCNQNKAKNKQVHIRIGINYGPVFIEENDISGDVVNVASRVESNTAVDSIYINKPVYDQIKDTDDIICRYVGEKSVKGKDESLCLYRVVWSDEIQTADLLRDNSEKSNTLEGKALLIDIQKDGTRLKLKSSEIKDTTLAYQDEISIAEDKIKTLCSSIVQLQHKSNTVEKVNKELFNNLKSIGLELYNILFPSGIKERLNNTDVNTLILSIDEALLYIPWELIYNGDEFLCLKYNMSRLVSTKMDFNPRQRKLAIPLKMLIIADPQNNLPSSYTEGQTLLEYMKNKETLVNTTLKSRDINVNEIIEIFGYFDILHFAGHVDACSEDTEHTGLLFNNGKLSGKTIKEISKKTALPSLVFLNACCSGLTKSELDLKTGYNENFNLTNALLFGGTRHYIGTFWKIQDEAGQVFANKFYGELFKGAAIGEAVRNARNALINKYGLDSLKWTGYMLYGDPVFSYNSQISKEQSQEQRQEASRDKEDQQQQQDQYRQESHLRGITKSNPKLPVLITIIIACLILGVLFLYNSKGNHNILSAAKSSEAVSPTSSKDQDKEQEIDALVADLAQKYKEGNYLDNKSNKDDWSSKTLAMVFMDIKEQGLDSSQKDRIIDGIIQNLQTTDRIKVVDRQILDKLLRELKLGTSELADPNTAVKIGGLLSARLIATGSVVKDKETWNVSLRIIETETSAIKAVVSTDIDAKESKNIPEKLSEVMLNRIKSVYPLKGKILTYNPEEVIIDIGSSIGLKKGDKLEVVSEDEFVIGTLEVTEAAANKAKTKVLSGTDNIQKDYKVREIL